MYWDGNPQRVRRIPVRVANGQDTPSSQEGQPKEIDGVVESSLTGRDEVASPIVDELDWQSLALRLQADMENYRKRQARRADDAVAEERERLLRLMLPVADNLARALDQDEQGNEVLRQGVELTYRELMRLLEAEGVTRVEAVGQTFTPELHEAVATVMSEAEAGGTVVEEVQGGYKLGEKLLRPARVVVAA
jgi:molecular chaperone GrpE